MNIVTHRLTLRPVALRDADALHQIRSNIVVNQFIGRVLETDVSETVAFISQRIADMAICKAYYWVICLKDQDTPIGTVCYWNLESARNLAEFGYELHPDWQSKGYMQEAMEAMIQFGFTKLGFRVIKALTHPDNVASVRILERCGFIQDQESRWHSLEESEGYWVYFLTA